MLTARIVSQQLGISRRHVYALHHRGKLPGYWFDGALRFAPEDVEVYRQSCQYVGTAGTSAGATNLTATLKVSASGLANYFRAAGVKPKLTNSTASKARGCTRLQLVSKTTTG